MREIMKILEDALFSGSIHIAPRSGLLFAAAFKNNNKQKEVIIEQSDKGLNHLYMLLAARISGNDEIRKQADTLYKYPLAIASERRIENSIRRTYVYMTRSTDEIFVTLERVTDNIYGFPGLCARKGEGASIEMALKNALDAEPYRVHGLRFEE